MNELRTKRRRYKYGVALPKNVKDAINILDPLEGNSLWKEAIELERKAFDDAKMFEFLPPGSAPPRGYQRIPVFMMFDVRQDLRRKARFCAGEHVTRPSYEERYASVV